MMIADDSFRAAISASNRTHRVRAPTRLYAKHHRSHESGEGANRKQTLKVPQGILTRPGLEEQRAAKPGQTGGGSPARDGALCLTTGSQSNCFKTSPEVLVPGRGGTVDWCGSGMMLPRQRTLFLPTAACRASGDGDCRRGKSTGVRPVGVMAREKEESSLFRPRLATDPGVKTSCCASRAARSRSAADRGLRSRARLGPGGEPFVRHPKQFKPRQDRRAAGAPIE